MATTQLTAATFERTITDNPIVLVDWWAAWCGPCRMFAPVFEEASEKHADIVFGKVDTDAQQQLAGEFGIQSIPTLMVFRDGILLFAQPGMLPGPVLDELITKVRALDMNEVLKQIAEASRAADAR